MRKLTRFGAALFVTFAVMSLTSQAIAACLGVSRTITIKSFNPAMGTGPGGHIGLRDKEVVLTFDDGPIPATTGRIVTALAHECTRATFFVVGSMARNNPKMLRRIAKSGHTIAHHTHTHDNLQGKALTASKKDIQRGYNDVMKALGPLKGHASKLFRYPYLSRNARLDQIVRQNGLLPFSASILSQDWKKGSPASVVNRVMTRLNKQGRGVILLHDIQKRTAAALPTLLSRLKRDGYKVVHVRTAGSASVPVRVASVSNSKSKKSSSKIDQTKTGSVKKVKPRRSLLTSIFGSRQALKSANAAKKSKKTSTKARTSASKLKSVKSVKKPAKKKLTSLQRKRLASLERSRALRSKTKRKTVGFFARTKPVAKKNKTGKRTVARKASIKKSKSKVSKRTKASHKKTKKVAAKKRTKTKTRAQRQREASLARAKAIRAAERKKRPKALIYFYRKKKKKT